MVRILAFVLVSLAVILPGGVQALGLGEIQLNSFLNQPLDAEIEIISSQRGETDGIKIKLASASAFERAGLEYSNVMRQIKFKVITKSDGSHVIKVTTRRGYREPFLNFLLEVNWSSGRILREYAALVDPPSLVQSTPAPVKASSGSRQSMAKSAPVKASKAPEQPLFGAPETHSDSMADSGGFIGDTYRTKRNDTAWQIARDVRPDQDVSVEQSMMSILRANPRAFIKQNVNRLKAGYVLNIPGRETMLSQSHGSAVTEIRAQTRAWKNRHSVAAAPKGHLEILPPKADSSSSNALGSNTGSSSADSNRDVMLAREAAEAQRQENSELRLRISELEELINGARLETRLKSDKMAALEQQLAKLSKESGEAPAVAAPVVPEEVIPEPVIPAEEVPAVSDSKPKESSAFVPAVPAPPGTPINQHVVGNFTPVDITKLPKSGLMAKPFKTSEKMADSPAEDGSAEGILAYFENNPVTLWIVIAAGGIFIVLVIVMMARSRRSDQFDESILQEQTFSENAFEETPVEEVVEEAVEEVAEEVPGDFFETVDVEKESDPEEPAPETDTSFLSDMVFSDMNDLEGGSGESDPLTEADVFLAYGRFGPAETMIKEAIAKEPERNDLRLKLLEIFYSAKNKDAFETGAVAFNDDLAANPDSETWEKVVEMGGDLCPDHALFSTDNVPTEDMPGTVAGDEDDTAAMDFDLGEFEDQIESLGLDDTESSESSEMDGLDLDLDEINSDGAEAEDPTLEITTELEDIAGTLGSDPEDVTQELDVDGDSDDVTQELEVNKKMERTQEIASDDLNNLNDLDEITQELKIPDLADELDLGETAESPLEEDDMDPDDALADIDEVGTKLDLARAYIDMGDPEGAKSILNEVLDEGNDEQKGEAEILIEKL
ncbi:MAG: FimV family protein [Gammaproteobacteria bacterium]|nr:FimV family protein [Gammaproteobacteria bacterium]